MAERYRKRPVVIEAERVDRDKLHRLSPEFRAEVHHDHCCAGPHVHTLEGPLAVSDGDWLIKGVKGEFYPCKPDIFEATYERVGSGDEPSDEDRIRDAMAEAQDHPGRIVTR